MIYCGIDPGYDGGIAFIGDVGQEDNPFIGISPSVYATPTLKIHGKPRKGCKTRTVRQYDEQAIKTILLEGDPDMVFIEHQQPMSRKDQETGKVVAQGARSNFSCGEGFGFYRGLLVGLGIPYQVVPVKRWQSTMFEGLPASTSSADTKAKSAIIASRLFAGMDLRRTERCSNPHDGKCDALCIAAYGRRISGHAAQS